MEFLRKLTDFIMPIEESEELVEEQTVKVESHQATAQAFAQPIMEERKVANGGTVSYQTGTVSYGGMSSAVSPLRDTAVPQTSRPQLTVHTTKPQELMIKLYVPTDFEQVTSVADDIKSKRAVVINYEKVDLAEQRRICDFVNGVCYVTNGDAKRISSNIVLYVPDGVDAEEAMISTLTA